jgi:hypothetical protein
MTSTFNISFTVKTAHLGGADLGLRTGRVGSLQYATRRPAGPKTVIVEASRTANLDALAASGAG